MNDMTQRLDTLCPQDNEASCHKSLSELEAFILMDSTLAALNKQYLESRDHRRQLANLNGADDPMVEVAMDMEDSNWCAMQTRYLELREERELMEKAQRMMRASEEKVEQEKVLKKQRNKHELAYFTRMLEKIREQNNKTPEILEWIFVFMLFRTQPFNHAARFGL